MNLQRVESAGSQSKQPEAASREPRSANRGYATPMKIAVALALLFWTAGDNWPQWRGPAGLGVSPSGGYAEEWSPTRNVAWKTPVEGRGHSSPVVWDNRVYLTTSVEGGPAPAGHKAIDHLGYDMKWGYLHPDSTGADRQYTLKVLAFDARTGKKVWERTAYDGVMYDNRHRKNTYASSTVATDGKLVYAFFESAGLYCYDADGTLVWKKSFGGIGKGGMGPGTSPILHNDLVIVQCDQEMGDGFVHRRARPAHGQGRLAGDADDAAQLGDADHRAHTAAPRDDLVGSRGGDCVRSRHRPRALAGRRRPEPSDPESRGGPWAGVHDGGEPGEGRARDQNRR